MKTTLMLFFISFPLFLFGQERSEIISILKEYSKNVGKPGYQHQYVDDKLNPALFKLEKIVCANNDRELFEHFLDMVVASTGSANETPSDVLGGIFICRTTLVELELKGKYKNSGLIEELSFGFANRTFDAKERTSNYNELKLCLKKIGE
jgi:hypothetical protein